MGGKGFKKPPCMSSMALLSWPGLGFFSPEVKPSSPQQPSVTSCSCTYLVASSWEWVWQPPRSPTLPVLTQDDGDVHPEDHETTSSGAALPQGQTLPRSLAPSITQPRAPVTPRLPVPVYPDGPPAPYPRPPAGGCQTPGDFRAFTFLACKRFCSDSSLRRAMVGSCAAPAGEGLVFAAREPLPGISRCAGPSGSFIVVSRGFAFPTGWRMSFWQPWL